MVSFLAGLLLCVCMGVVDVCVCLHGIDVKCCTHKVTEVPWTIHPPTEACVCCVSCACAHLCTYLVFTQISTLLGQYRAGWGSVSIIP